MNGDPEWRGWADNVAAGLIEERDAAEARYIREHKRAVFMFETLHKVNDAIPDINGGRSFTRERLHESLTDVMHAIGQWINASAGDISWTEIDFDFDEWERDYFGPRPDLSTQDKSFGDA